MTQWPLRQIHKEINAYYKKHLAALSSPFSSSSSTLPCPHPSIAQSCESIRTHAGTHTQTHAHMYVQTSVCIMYVAWPDKINAALSIKLLHFTTNPRQRKSEREWERARSTSRSKRYWTTTDYGGKKGWRGALSIDLGPQICVTLDSN